MVNPRSLENLTKTQFQPLGKKALAKKPLAVKVPEDIDELVRSLPNPSEWLRKIIVEAAQRELLPPDYDPEED